MFSSFQKAWVAKLSSERPTVAFHASINNWFGKHALIQLLRQFSKVCTQTNIDNNLLHILCLLLSEADEHIVT